MKILHLPGTTEGSRKNNPFVSDHNLKNCYNHFLITGTTTTSSHYFSLSPGRVCSILLVDNGHINFVHYAIRAQDHFSCGYFEISRQQGGETDLKKYMDRSHPFKFWKPITQKVYLLLQRDIKRKEREAKGKKSLTNVLPVSKRKI